MGRLSHHDASVLVNEGPAHPELLELADGLARLLGVSEVGAWWGPAAPDALEELREGLTSDDVAILRLTADPSGARLSLRSAVEAARGTGLQVAWSGLARNGSEDIRRETPLLVVAADRADQVRSALATGTASLLFDPSAPVDAALDRPVRVCVASYEVVGPTRNGGIGTANTSLAEALAAAGNDVTLLYIGSHVLDESTRSRWVHHYDRRGVRFRDLPGGAHLAVDTPHFNQARAYELYHWLAERDRERAWDVIHVPDCQGHGYYALLARRLGLAFDACTFVVGAHSPTRWVYEANGWTIDNAHRLADDFLERQCLELADVVISPSAYLLDWMERRGWKLPTRRFVQQYVASGAVGDGSPEGEDHERIAAAAVLPEGPGTQAARELGSPVELGEVAPARKAPPEEGGPRAIAELVFFGRLETRKGVETFCDALDVLAEEREAWPGLRVTFMGSETPIDGVMAGEYVRDRSRRWPWRYRLETGLNQLEAVAYIRQPGRLAVMPSPVDNSPNAVLEALGLGIPFITSRGGGIPELIHPLDVDVATFDPGGHGGASLAAAMRAAVGNSEALRPRFAIDPDVNRSVHVRWHERVAASPPRGSASGRNGYEAKARPTSVSACLGADGDLDSFERARESLEEQDLADAELVVALPEGTRGAWSSGVTSELRDRGWRVVEGRAGALDAAAAAAATGEWLFLCEPSAAARPALLSTLVASAQRARADLVTTAARYRDEAKVGEPGAWQENVPLGSAPLVGLFYDCFGVGGVLVRRETFESLGGFGVDGPPAVRRRDLLCRAALAEVHSTVVPEPLLDYDREAAEGRRTSRTETALRTAQPYQSGLPDDLTDLPGLALSLSLVPRPVGDTAHVENYARSLEQDLHVISSSRSWRMTRPFRAAVAVLRRMV